MSNLISVIIPVFNRFNLVEKSIQSVLNQSYLDIEIIIVDDHSSDGIFTFFNENMSIYRLDQNSGPGFCRQFGLENSKGNYILFLDSDDILKPDFLEKSIEKHIELNNTISFTYVHSGVLGSDSTWNNTDKEYTNIFPTLLKGRQWPTSALLWNKEFLPKWNYYRSWEDYDIEFRAALNCNKIGFVKEKLVYISPPDANSLSGQKKSIKEIENQWAILNFLTDNKSAYNELLSQNQYNSVWNNVKLRKLKLIRDMIKINVGDSSDMFLQLSESKVQLFIYKLLNTTSQKLLTIYIKFKIRNLNSCVDYSAI